MRTALILSTLTALLALTLGTGCDSGSGSDQPGADTASPDITAPDTAEEDRSSPGSEATFVTYNTGLARNFVPFAEERLDSLIAAIAALDADVICLQEVWEDGNRDALLAATAEAFPEARYFETEEEGGEEAACTEEETTPLLTCVEAFCAETDDLTTCVMTNCLAEFGSVSQSCSTCLAAHIAEPLDDIVNACLTSGGQLLFEGRNGLLLLSRLPLGDGGHIMLDSFFTQRAVLWQEVLTDGGSHHVFCTHLNAALDEVQYGGAFDSWEDEQAHQADQLLSWMGDRAGADQARIILGDLNCSPDVPPEITGEFQETFDKFITAGFTSPYLALDAPPCTWCEDNPLTGSETSRIIDHALLSGVPGQAVAERIMTDTISIETEEGPKDIPLSDHFGVKVTITSD